MNTITEPRAERRSVTGLLSDLWRESSTLVRQEAELAKAEMSEKVSEMETAGVSLVVAGAVLFAGVIMLLLSAAAALDHVLPPDMADWLSPLIVGVVVVLIAAALLANARHRLTGDNLAPRRTLRSLDRDRRMAKEHLA
jgi:xanthine/uracil permease